MNGFSRHRWTVVVVLFFALVAPQGLADPPDIFRDFRFITAWSTVHVTGPDYDIDLAIEGDMGLVTGYDYVIDPVSQLPQLIRYAQFDYVDAILFNPLSLAPMPVPGWDLDERLNLTGLEGTFEGGDPLHLSFHGEDGQAQPIQLEGTFSGKLLHLVGENSPGCCNFYEYDIDAYAYLKPYPDWNSDHIVDAADYVALRKAGGTNDDHDIWQGDFGAPIATGDGSGSFSTAVPEPTTLALLLVSVLAFSPTFPRAARP
jgi:hypothetical protein